MTEATEENGQLLDEAVCEFQKISIRKSSPAYTFFHTEFESCMDAINEGDDCLDRNPYFSLSLVRKNNPVLK